MPRLCEREVRAIEALLCTIPAKVQHVPAHNIYLLTVGTKLTKRTNNSPSTCMPAHQSETHPKPVFNILHLFFGFFCVKCVMLNFWHHEAIGSVMRLHICISKDRNNHYTQKTEYNVNSYNKDIVSFCYQTLISAGKMKSVPYY